MYKLKIIKYKPKYSRVSMDNLTNVDIESKVTTVVESTLRSGYRNVPVMPKLHAEAIIALAKHPVRYLLGVAQYIGLHLGKENPTTVVLRISQITDELGLSEPSVVKAIKLLEELKYIENTGKSSYRVSPNLAFYGTNIEWSLAIQMEAEGKTNEEFLVAKESINKQLRENEMLAGIKEV